MNSHDELGAVPDRAARLGASLKKSRRNSPTRSTSALDFPTESFAALREARSARGADPGRVGWPRRIAARGRRSGDRARPLLRVDRNDFRDARDPGRLPGSARPQPGPAGVPASGRRRAAAARVGHDRDRHRRQRAHEFLRRRDAMAIELPAREDRAGHLLRRVRRRGLGHGPPHARQPVQRPVARGLHARESDADARSRAGTRSVFAVPAASASSLQASGDAQYILDDPYGDISSQTMLPTSHIVWTSLWLGIALAADDKARRYVQAEARKNAGRHAARRAAAGRARHRRSAAGRIGARPDPSLSRDRR